MLFLVLMVVSAERRAERLELRILKMKREADKHVQKEADQTDFWKENFTFWESARELERQNVWFIFLVF